MCAYLWYGKFNIAYQSAQGDGSTPVLRFNMQEDYNIKHIDSKMLTLEF